MSGSSGTGAACTSIGGSLSWIPSSPPSSTSLAALGVLEFTFIWNDYFWALILTQGDNVKPITIGLDMLRGQWVATYNLIAAGSVLAALPPVIMFFAMQRHFIMGLTFGAVKG